jgi:hypothetical protein
MNDSKGDDITPLVEELESVPLMWEEPSPSALVLTDEEWDLLAYICEDFLASTAHAPEEAMDLANRIIAAAEGGHD